MTIHFIDRFHRKKGIWQIEEELRDGFYRIPGIKVLRKTTSVFSPAVITRQNLDYSLDVYGYRGMAAITHIHKGIDQNVLANIPIPSGYHLSFAFRDSCCCWIGR